MSNTRNMFSQALIDSNKYMNNNFKNNKYDPFFNHNNIKQRNNIKPFYQNNYNINTNLYNYSSYNILNNINYMNRKTNLYNDKSSFLKLSENQNQKNYSKFSSIKKEDNIFKKINTLKRKKRRKPSIDTTVSTSSYTSSLNYEIEESKNDTVEEEEKEDEQSDDNSWISSQDDKDCKNENEYESENIKKNDENKISDKNEIYEVNPKFENTEILRVCVKISKNKNAIFRLKRYDDVFETIKIFCEINSINEKLIKPLIIKSLSTMNTIYQIMNSTLNNEQIQIMTKIQKEKNKNL